MPNPSFLRALSIAGLTLASLASPIACSGGNGSDGAGSGGSPDLCGGSSCGEGEACCGEACVDTATDRDHCGACGAACAADQACSGGVCGCSAGVAFAIDDRSPASFAPSVAGDEPVRVTFTCAVDPATVTPGSLVVHGDFTGRYEGKLSVEGNAVTFAPAAPWKPGERVVVIVTRAIGGGGGARLAAPWQWEFLGRATGGTGMFASGGEAPGTGDEKDVALGDLDGDGDLDAVIARDAFFGIPSAVCLNDGKASFTCADLPGGPTPTQAVALGDLDGDGDLDLVLANDGGLDDAPNVVFFNDGKGTFTQGSQALGINAEDVAIGDLDGDGDLDVYVARSGFINGDTPGEHNLVFRNDGAGVFTEEILTKYRRNTDRIQLRDFDGDGDLDVAARHSTIEGDTLPLDFLYVNDGSGNLDEGHALSSQSVDAAADVDENGTLDLLGSGMWLNDGAGVFTDQSATIPGQGELSVEGVGDLDGDGHLDLAVERWHDNYQQYTYIGDGKAAFSVGPQNGYLHLAGLRLGDLDGDGDLDALLFGSSDVWLNP